MNDSFSIQQPPGYVAVPHDDKLMEAIAALDLFRRSLHLRSPFRLRVATDRPVEEATLQNWMLGYAVLGMDIPSLYLNKGVVLPSLFRSEELEQSVHRPEESNNTGTFQESERIPHKGINKHVKYLHTFSNMIYQTSKHQSHKVYPSHLSSQAVSPDSSHSSQYTPRFFPVTYTMLPSFHHMPSSSPHKPTSTHYYYTCLKETCAVADPLLASDQNLPQHLQAAVKKALSEVASHENNQHKDVHEAFTVEDFFNNPNLFKLYYGGR